LPSGASLGLTAAMTAATAIVAALPASAGTAALAGSAAARAGGASQVQADRIRAQEWWLANLHVPQAWQFSRGAGITVAVLSSGVDAAHPDLTGSVVTGPDLTGSGETAGPPSWGIEGTSAASIIAGHGDNAGHASGIIGVAPAARILAIRVVLDATDPLNGNPADTSRLPAAIAAGIRYAVGHGAQVINLPLDPASLASDGAATGGLSAAAGGSAAEQSAVSYALGKGVVLVAPAGDNGEDGNKPTFPAAYPGVIALGAVDRHFVRAGFSIRQSYVALTAPGVNLTTASPPSGYRNMSTTDAASAVVAGVAALIRSRYPRLTGSQVRQALLAGSVARPPSATAAGDGGGTVDAAAAVQAAAVIAAPRPAASAPATSPAAAQAPAGKTRPSAGQPRAGILGRATTVLRDAAMAAGGLIAALLASLAGIRIRRRRAERGGIPAPEPRALLNAPSGTLATVGAARHTRAAAAEPAPAARMATPGAAPRRTGPGRQDRRTRNRGRSGGRSAAGSRISTHGLRVRVTPVPRTVTRAQLSASGGPPWEPAPMPPEVALPETARPVPDPFALFAPQAPAAPATPAPWDVGQPLPPVSRLRSGGPVPSVDPAFPGGTVPPRRPAMPPRPTAAEGRPPLARPSSFAGSSRPPGPPRPAVPPPVAPETAAPETLAASGQPVVPAQPPGTGPSTTPPPGSPGSGSPRWHRSPYAGRHTSDTGPQPAVPAPPGEPGHSPGERPGDAPSGPLYIWNPAALTEPFPSAPPPGDAGPPGEGTGETGNPVP
jgi:subtilisin family serine protease